MSMNIEGICLGTYQIEKLLVSCRSGEVYQAQDLLLGRERVLLHCLNLIGGTPDKVEKLAARLAALGYVNQAGIVRVLNFFCWDEHYWVITDCPGGWPLESYLNACSPEEAEKLWGQARELVEYLHAYYGGYAHGSLVFESFRVGYNGRLYLIELGWLTGSFGQEKAMEADLLALQGLRQPAGAVRGTGLTNLIKASRKKFTGTCPGCAKYLFSPVLFCIHCGYDLSVLLPSPLGLVLVDQKHGDRELLAAAQLGQAYSIYRLELEAALVNGGLLKWLRELGEGELVTLLEKGLRAREDRSSLLARLVHRVLGNRPGEFWSEPVFLDLGGEAETGTFNLYTSLGLVYGKVLGSCGKKGITASPQVFGGGSVNIIVKIDRSGLAPGRHLALLELEVNGRQEFLEVFFNVN